MSSQYRVNHPCAHFVQQNEFYFCVCASAGSGRQWFNKMTDFYRLQDSLMQRPSTTSAKLRHSPVAITEGSAIADTDRIIPQSVIIPAQIIEEAKIESKQLVPLPLLSVQRDGEVVPPTARPSWRTLLQSPLGSFLTGLKPRATFIQLAGHKGDFVSGQGGVIYKKSSKLEKAALEELMNDTLKHSVPLYFKPVMLRDEDNNPVEYLELQDLLCFFDDPSVMDVKMGVRTFQEGEINKTKRRMDLLQKMIKLDPNGPSEEEMQLGITKARYMIFRERLSSTNTLGLRIEAIKRCGEKPKNDFQKVKDKDEIQRLLKMYLPDDSELRRTVLSNILDKMSILREKLVDSEFFKYHELIGSSLLFIYDSSGSVGIWLIDFGKTSRSEQPLQHDVRWTMGTREDGYLLGFDNLTSLFQESRRPLAGVAANKMQRPSPIMSLIQYASSFKVVKAFRIACLWNVSQRRLRYTTWRQFLACSVCDAFCIHIVWHLLLLLCASCFRLEHVHDGVDAVEIYAQRVMHWVASHPVGLKLCAPLSLMYASVFLYTVRLWTHMVHVVINVGVWLGASVHASTGLYILGASGTFALTADIITYALPWHIIVFYQTFRVLYCCQLAVIKSVALTFMGWKQNPLRQRIDSCTFTFSEMMIGTLVLAIAVFFLPTTTVFYVFFCLALSSLIATGQVFSWAAQKTLGFIYASSFSNDNGNNQRNQRINLNMYTGFTGCKTSSSLNSSQPQTNVQDDPKKMKAYKLVIADTLIPSPPLWVYKISVKVLRWASNILRGNVIVIIPGIDHQRSIAENQSFNLYTNARETKTE
eukprot:gene282-3654_t